MLFDDFAFLRGHCLHYLLINLACFSSIFYHKWSQQSLQKLTTVVVFSILFRCIFRGSFFDAFCVLVPFLVSLWVPSCLTCAPLGALLAPLGALLAHFGSLLVDFGSLLGRFCSRRSCFF